MTGVFSDLRFALRTLCRRPGFALIAVVTLALGIGANTAIFSVADAVLLRPLPYPNPQRLVMIGETSDLKGTYNIGYLTYADWKARLQWIESIAVYRTSDQAITSDGEPEQLYTLRASHELLPMLGIQPLLGRRFSPAEDRPRQNRVVLLTYGLWQRRFGMDPRVVGRTIQLNEQPFVVIGVLPSTFDPVLPEQDRPIEMVIPLGYDVTFGDSCRDCRHLRAIARLRPGVTLSGAAAELGEQYRAMSAAFPDAYRTEKPVLLPFRKLILGKLERPTILLLLAAGLVLLIACANVASLLLTRATQRQREFAVRAALGAAATRLLRQSLVETLLLAFLGGAAGVLLSLWATPALLALAPGQVPSAGLTLPVLLASAGLSLLAGLAAGLTPAWRASRLAVVTGLRDGTRTSDSRHSLRLSNGLVVAELAMSLVLAVAATDLVLSLIRLLSVNPGFDSHGLVTANLNSAGPRYPQEADDARFFENVLRAIRSQPGLESVAATSVLPMSKNYDTAGLFVEGVPQQSDLSPDRYIVTPEYLQVMRMRLLRGRPLQESDRFTAPRVALINQSGAQRLFGSPDRTLGRRIQLGGFSADRWATIVGIVDDVHQYGLDTAPQIQVYFPQAQERRGYLTLVVRSPLETSAALASLKRAIASVDPTRALSEVHTMEELFTISTAQRRFLVVLLATYGGLALLLALVGVFGVVSVAVERRMHEIGIRMALGASRPDVLSLVLGQSGLLVMAGLTLGALGTLAAGPLLASELYGIHANDLRVLLTVSGAVALAAVAATLRPAMRASRLDPARVLGTE